MRIVKDNYKRDLVGVLLSNYVSQVFSIVVQIVLMPLYINYYGFEGFGLVTFLYALLASLDLGLGAVVNRVIADASCGTKTLLRKSIQTYETTYLVLALLLLISANYLSENLAYFWLKIDGYQPDMVENIIFWGLMMLSVRWPLICFQNMFRGLEKHHKNNLIIIITTTFRGIAAFAVMKAGFGLADVFIALFFIGCIELIIYYIALHQGTYIGYKIGWHRSVFLDNFSFAWRQWIASIAAILLKQLDRFMLGILVSVEAVGIYGVAHTFVQGIPLIVMPVFNAIYPRLTKLFTLKKYDEIKDILFWATRGLMLLVVPVCMILIYSGSDIAAWLISTFDHNEEIDYILKLLVMAAMINAPMQLQLALALASSRSYIPMYTNLIAVGLLVPAMYICINEFGLYGAGVAWLLFNIAYFAIVPVFVMGEFENMSYFRWVFIENLFVIIVAFLLFAGINWILNDVELNVIHLSILQLVVFGMFGFYWMNQYRNDVIHRDDK